MHLADAQGVARPLGLVAAQLRRRVRRVRAVGSLLPSPGVLRGNATNPIGPLVLEDINVTTERSRPWICQHAEVVVADVQPAVADSSGVGCVVRPR